MKLYEVLLEDTKQVQEAPMGMLNKLGNKAMAAFGGDTRGGRAIGKLSTGTLANQLNKEFQIYLGSSGRDATKDAVIGFLRSKKYPTQGAATIINQALKAQANANTAPTGPTAGLGSRVKGAMNKVINKVSSKKPVAPAAPRVEPTGSPEPVISSSKINTGNMVAEAAPGILSQAIIDKAILKAAQEADILKNKQANTPAQKSNTADAQPDAAADTAAEPAAPAAKGGFAAGLKKGFTGKTPAAPAANTATTPDIAELEQRIAAIEKQIGLS